MPHGMRHQYICLDDKNEGTQGTCITTVYCSCERGQECPVSDPDLSYYARARTGESTSCGYNRCGGNKGESEIDNRVVRTLLKISLFRV